jgi:hypothetical protein
LLTGVQMGRHQEIGLLSRRLLPTLDHVILSRLGWATTDGWQSTDHPILA